MSGLKGGRANTAHLAGLISSHRRFFGQAGSSHRRRVAFRLAEGRQLGPPLSNLAFFTPRAPGTARATASQPTKSERASGNGRRNVLCCYSSRDCLLLQLVEDLRPLRFACATRRFASNFPAGGKALSARASASSSPTPSAATTAAAVDVGERVSECVCLQGSLVHFLPVRG